MWVALLVWVRAIFDAQSRRHLWRRLVCRVRGHDARHVLACGCRRCLRCGQPDALNDLFCMDRTAASASGVRAVDTARRAKQRAETKRARRRERNLRLAGGAAVLALALAPACSSGPQFVTPTSPVNVSCRWEANACPRTLDGGLEDARATSGAENVGGCDCIIDRSSSAPETESTGVQTGPVQVDPETHVSATGG